MKPLYPDIDKTEYGNRISKAQKLMKEHGLHALFISSVVNSYYFTGFDSLQLYPPEADRTWALIISRDADPVWITSQSFRKSFEALAWPTEIRSYQGRKDQVSVIMDAWNELGLKGVKVGAELGLGSNRIYLPGQIFLDLANICSFVDASNLIDSIRLIKSQEEVSRLRTAAEISDRAIQRLISKIEVGMTERKIAQLLGAYMLEEGADRPYYLLVRAGERYLNKLSCSLPIDKKIDKGEYVKIEYSADYRHYVNEGKTLALFDAQPKPSERDHYHLLVEAMKAGAKAARPGATAADVAEAQKRLFEEAGIELPEGKTFGHGTGMNCHEPPQLGPDDKTVLQAGMVFVVEPGDIPNVGGLNREMSTGNTVIVKTSGAAERLPPLSEEITLV